MISDTLELLRPKIKLCNSLEESIRQVHDLEQEFLIKLGLVNDKDSKDSMTEGENLEDDEEEEEGGAETEEQSGNESEVNEPEEEEGSDNDEDEGEEEEEENTDYLTDSNKENETDEENTVCMAENLLLEIVQHFHSISVSATKVLFLLIIENCFFRHLFSVCFPKYFSLTSSFNI